ncbi:p16 [Baboon orthoreovirus]|uniref:p16 n=1 Tax=Baboon orthoreovirus TaxID=75888 RepID=Q918V5_9REOV|nr:p16 [Baboon orthoreovirus]AAL01374.1 p16 [Baboon orthoreovirus]
MMEETQMEVSTFEWPKSLDESLQVLCNELKGKTEWQDDMEDWMPYWIYMKHDGIAISQSRYSLLQQLAVWVWKCFDFDMCVYNIWTTWLVKHACSRCPEFDDEAFWSGVPTIIKLVIRKTMHRYAYLDDSTLADLTEQVGL